MHERSSLTIAAYGGTIPAAATTEHVRWHLTFGKGLRPQTLDCNLCVKLLRQRLVSLQNEALLISLRFGKCAFRLRFNLGFYVVALASLLGDRRSLVGHGPRCM